MNGHAAFKAFTDIRIRNNTGIAPFGLGFIDGRIGLFQNVLDSFATRPDGRTNRCRQIDQAPII